MILIFSLLFATTTIGQTLEDIHWVSEEFPPFNYLDENNTPKGFMLEILLEVWKKVGLRKSSNAIDFLPWARGYQMVQNDPKVCLFAMAMTPERKKLFKFVGPIGGSHIGIITKKSKNLKIKTLSDLTPLTIGVVRDDIGEHLLKSKGVPSSRFHQVVSRESLIGMLGKDRVDAISYGMATAFWTMKQLGMDTNQYELSYVLKKGISGYAFHKDVNPRLIQTLQNALNELIADGTVKRIRDSYL